MFDGLRRAISEVGDMPYLMRRAQRSQEWTVFKKMLYGFGGCATVSASWVRGLVDSILVGEE